MEFGRNWMDLPSRYKSLVKEPVIVEATPFVGV